MCAPFTLALNMLGRRIPADVQLLVGDRSDIELRAITVAFVIPTKAKPKILAQ